MCPADILVLESFHLTKKYLLSTKVHFKLMPDSNLNNLRLVFVLEYAFVASLTFTYRLARWQSLSVGLCLQAFV